MTASQHLRLFSFGALVGLFVALTPSCPPPKSCDAENCNGCCTEDLDCVKPSQMDNDACGKGGASCKACGDETTCFESECTPNNQLPDAGVICAVQADCPDSLACFEDGGCAPCTAQADCETGNACHEGGTCGPCTAQSECAGGQACLTDGTCAPCTAQSDCIDGHTCLPDSTCGPCQAQADCAPGTACFPDGECRPCITDFDCGTGTVCLPSGSCGLTGNEGPHLASACGSDADCQEYSDETDPCYTYEYGCVCHKRGVEAEGTCRRRKLACAPCNNDAECGADEAIFNLGLGQGRCSALDGDSSGEKYCQLKPTSGPCGCGYVPGTGGFCVPQSGSCTDVACGDDADCPSGKVCSVKGGGSCGGICVNSCRWDFQTKRADCPPNRTCWVDQANLDPNSSKYGQGRCLSPCQDDAACTVDGGDPWGGPDLVCVQETGDHAKRCRARGECMDTLECPNGVFPSVGYCDRATFECKDTGCREGVDPMTSAPYRDCVVSYLCENAQCRRATCVEIGLGAACGRLKYCCGDDKNGNGVADPCPADPNEMDEAQCYTAPNPPFCQPCENDSECEALKSNEWGCGMPGFPNCATAPALCREGVCQVPTYSDDIEKARKACPAGLGVGWIRPETNIVEEGAIGYPAHFCQDDDDCSPRLPDGSPGVGGKCEADPGLGSLLDGGPRLACRCDQGSGTSQCPNGGQYPGLTEVTSFCRTALGDQTGRNTCIISAVCQLSGGIIGDPVEQAGCGLQ